MESGESAEQRSLFFCTLYSSSYLYSNTDSVKLTTQRPVQIRNKKYSHNEKSCNNNTFSVPCKCTNNRTMSKLKSMPFYFLNILKWCFFLLHSTQVGTPCTLLCFRGERHCTRHFEFCRSLSLEAAQRTSFHWGYLQTEANMNHTIPYSFTFSTFRL